MCHFTHRASISSTSYFGMILGEPGCNDKCTVAIPGVSPNAKYCWGPGPKNCQKMNKVSCAADCKNRCYGPGVGQCCNEHCAGGCDGPMSTDCWVRELNQTTKTHLGGCDLLQFTQRQHY